MSTVAKTLKLLGYLKTTSPELGLSEFVRLSGYDKASTHRRLTELLNAGFLEQDPQTRAYRLGTALSRLALVREQSFPASESAHRVVRDLYNAVQETAHVSVIQGTAGLSTIAHVDDRSHANRVYIEPADMLPFHATASGLAVLAFSDDAFRDAVLNQAFDAITEDTETNPEVVELHVEDARRTGFGRSEGAYEAGVHSIGAPVFGRDGQCVGAIAIALPKSRLTAETEPHIMAKLTHAAVELSSFWGGSLPPSLVRAWRKMGIEASIP